MIPSKIWTEHPSTLNPGMSYYIHSTLRRVVRFDRNTNTWNIYFPTDTKYPLGFDNPHGAMKVAERLPLVKRT